ncbi:MAG: YfiR family protein [Desulfuromonadales bacterium]|nr:YfiR family protein [Desulfuromonadales bacterium]
MSLARHLKILLVFLFAVTAATECYADVKPYGEYQVKAVFLLNLTSFVSWPAESFSAPAEPFRVVILGDDPFGAVLDKAIKGESVQGHPIVIERRTYREGAQPCHLLFISPSLKRKVPEILANVKNMPLLTVADQAGFCRQGGMINLIYRNGRVLIEANARAAENSGLQINSKLLRLSIPY